MIAQHGQRGHAGDEDVTENDEGGEADLASVVKEGPEKLLQGKPSWPGGGSVQAPEQSISHGIFLSAPAAMSWSLMYWMHRNRATVSGAHTTGGRVVRDEAREELSQESKFRLYSRNNGESLESFF